MIPQSRRATLRSDGRLLGKFRMRRGNYLGGSTIIRARPKLTGRKVPHKGAIHAWTEDAAASGFAIPDGITLLPIQTSQNPNYDKSKKANLVKKGGARKKKRVLSCERHPHRCGVKPTLVSGLSELPHVAQGPPRGQNPCEAEGAGGPLLSNDAHLGKTGLHERTISEW